MFCQLCQHVTEAHRKAHAARTACERSEYRVSGSGAVSGRRAEYGAARSARRVVERRASVFDYTYITFFSDFQKRDVYDFSKSRSLKVVSKSSVLNPPN